MFLGPSLRQVRVLHTLDSDMICAILAHIQHTSPHLRSLELFSCPLTGLLILPQFRKLEHFRLTNYTTASSAPGASPLVTIPPFSNSSALKSLQIPIPEWFTASSLALSSLPFLTDLYLYRVRNFRSLINLLDVNITTLTLLKIWATFPSEDPSVLDEVLQIISQHRNLEVLLIHARDIDITIPATWEFKTLFPLHHLRRLDLRLSEPDLRSDLFPQFNKACPHLEHFAAPPFCTSETIPSLSLEALALCAIHLPNLTSLKLKLDATAIPELTVIRSMNKINLYFSYSPIAEDTWAQSAAYISSVYPQGNLNHEFDPDRAEDEDEARCWENVIKFLPMLASV